MLVAAEVPRRRVGSREGHAALLHAIAHIEFNAINLALDCVYRFASLPDDFYTDWVGWQPKRLITSTWFVIGPCVRFRLREDFLHWRVVGDGRQDCGRSTLRAWRLSHASSRRALDATPLIIEKLRSIGDLESVAILDIILRDEVGHVALGDYWFRLFCGLAGLDPSRPI